MSTEKSQNSPFSRITRFWLKYEQKIILLLGLIVIAVFSFELGILRGQNYQKTPLIIEKPADPTVTPESTENPQKTQNLTSSDISNTIGEATPTSSQNTQNCPFVGSKNSDKYYPPACSFAKRIKPENLVCFKSEQDAESRGYKKSASCFK